MLDTVDELTLSRRQKPPGSHSGELAAALRDLASSNSDAAAQTAYDCVLSAVGNNHRGTYFPVVLDVVPYLGEILEHGGPCACARTLDVLIDLVASFVPDSEVVSEGEPRAEDLPRLLRARVRELMPTIQRLAGQSSTVDVQHLAQDLLGRVAEE